MRSFNKLKFGNWISELQHLLPAQAPLKDFVHHNTLHSFQHLSFFDGLKNASAELGYETLMSADWYSEKFLNHEINPDILKNILQNEHTLESFGIKTFEDFLNYKSDELSHPHSLRGLWKRYIHLDLDAVVHPLLFRITSSYLDQGISEFSFPNSTEGFLIDVLKAENQSVFSFFKSKETKRFINKHQHFSVSEFVWQLLSELVEDEDLFKYYLFEQQLLHPGWSGMINEISHSPNSLIQKRKINLLEFIALELLMEWDAIASNKPKYTSLQKIIKSDDELKKVDFKYGFDLDQIDFIIRTVWQKALEWTYYSKVIVALDHGNVYPAKEPQKSIQALFCIDDREGSLRRHLEQSNDNVQTFGTPGFFGLEFYFQPTNAVAFTKSCPAPLNPNYLIQEIGGKSQNTSDIHFSKRTHSLVLGWIITHTIAFWAVFRLIWQIFFPRNSRYSAEAQKHMDPNSSLTVFHHGDSLKGLQIGFTKEEAASRLELLLKSIGLASGFGENIYLISHGASSVNNPHYAAYDCGACCGRPGSVNARAMAQVANDAEIRVILETKGIIIPKSTLFIGALHDTTRDEVLFYDEPDVNSQNGKIHQLFRSQIFEALESNALERSKKFELINPLTSKSSIISKVRNRSLSLFEPRPELNHATNSLCIIGPRTFSKNVFFDRRAFLNSYCSEEDENGDLLYGIIKAAAPVCGGINLEYYFSRVDNHHLGAGSKLPHNVMGLIGVANGADGDLRPGLPSQMIEIHDPIRLLMVVNQKPEIVFQVIQRDSNTLEWFKNQWINLIVCHPITNEWFVLQSIENQSVTEIEFIGIKQSPFKEFVPPTFTNKSLIYQGSHQLPVVAILN